MSLYPAQLMYVESGPNQQILHKCINNNNNNNQVSRKFSLAHSRVKIWRFIDFSGTNSAPIFGVCWWFARTKTVLVLPNQQHTLKFGSTKPPVHPEEGDGVIS
jgi:hypothetical protein